MKKNNTILKISYFFICLTGPSVNHTLAQWNKINNQAFITNEIECINRVMKADDSLGKIRNHSCEKGTLSSSIINYINGLKKLDFRNCPADFVKAFYIHTKAWIAMLKVTKKYPLLRGEMHELFDQLEKGKDGVAFKIKLGQIWSTWAEIEKIIRSYETIH